MGPVNIRFSKTYEFRREIHVSPDGNNSADGSAAYPLQTIQAAADLAQPGDTITVRAVVYRERIDPPRGGKSDEKRNDSR